MKKSIHKKVFVTGADGMLGSSICRELIMQSYNVKAMILPNRNTKSLLGLDVEIVKGDILDVNFLDKEMEDCDYVIHTAALTYVWPRRSEIVVKVNYQGTKNVMEVVEKLKIKRMVHIGTANSFGHGSKENPGDETIASKFIKYGVDYINSKADAQKLLLEKHSKTAFPVVIINPTYMIGPFDSGPSSGKIIIELLKNNIPGYSFGGKNFVCSTDVATASVNALKLGRLGNAYIAGNENLTYFQFFNRTCKILNKKFTLIKVPGFVILCIGFFNSLISRIVKKTPSLSFSMARMACVGQYYSSKKAQRELNMPQSPIENGVESCVKWFKSNDYIK